jgi:WD40 repeat protein
MHSRRCKDYRNRGVGQQVKEIMHSSAMTFYRANIIIPGSHVRIRVFSAKTLKPLAVLSFHRESVYSVAFCSLPAEKHYLVGASKDQRISLWTLY